MVGTILAAAVSGVWWLLAPLWAALVWCFTPVTFAIFAVGCVILYRYVTRNHDFWPSRGVRCMPPTRTLPWRTNPATNIMAFDQIMYDTFHGEEGYAGYLELMKPVLHLGNPDLIQAVCIKDFEHFTDRRMLSLSEEFHHMVSEKTGSDWKETRSILTPTFSGSKLKAMFQLCLDNAANLNDFLSKNTKTYGKVDVWNAFGRFTMDNIASCAFGVNCNSFNDPNTEFAQHAKRFLSPIKGYALLRLLCLMVFPTWIVFRVMPDPNRGSIDFFQRVIAQTIKHREKHNTLRRDYLQLLLETKDKNGQRKLDDDSIVMNSVLFFFAGYETTATLLAFCGYSLATSPGCQRRLLEEVDEVLGNHGGQLTYEAISEMKYLDQVIAETLRLYPIGARVERMCVRNYTLPGTTVQVPRGVLVQIPVLALHRDARHYPNPLKFDPDRFLPEAKEQRHSCVYLPFGAGPRNCIAMRFALFEAKVALVAVLKDNRLEPLEDTPPPPLPLDNTAFLNRPKDPVYLKVVPRN